MEYPKYVPEKVKRLIDSYLIGEPARDIPGYLSLLSDAERSLEKITSIIRWRTERGDDDYLPSLRFQRLEAEEHRNTLKRDVDCFERIAMDSRMEGCYQYISEDGFAADNADKFAKAAWATNLDYSKYRDRIKQVDDLRGDIAKAAQKLALLLREAATVGYSNWPSELFSISELLRKTDNNGESRRNFFMWQSMRRVVLGDREVSASQQPQFDIGSRTAPVEIQLVSMERLPEVDPEEEFRNTLRYAWGTAPELSELLQTVAAAAKSFYPKENGVIGAAIEKRQNNQKTDYLRGFGKSLTEDHGFSLSPSVKKAMAVIATVVLDSPEIDVTYDDVRKLFPS